MVAPGITSAAVKQKPHSGGIDDVVALFLCGGGLPGTLVLRTVVQGPSCQYDADEDARKYPSLHGITFQGRCGTAQQEGAGLLRNTMGKGEPHLFADPGSYPRPGTEAVVFGEQPGMAGDTQVFRRSQSSKSGCENIAFYCKLKKMQCPERRVLHGFR